LKTVPRKRSQLKILKVLLPFLLEQGLRPQMELSFQGLGVKKKKLL
jgi:hypothetical protein